MPEDPVRKEVVVSDSIKHDQEEQKEEKEESNEDEIG